MYEVNQSRNITEAPVSTTVVASTPVSTASSTNFGSGNLVFTNQRHYSTYAAANYRRVQLVSGVKRNGEFGMLLEATTNNGHIEVLSISNKLSKEELKSKKGELVLSSVADDQGSAFQMVHLSGSKWVSEDF